MASRNDKIVENLSYFNDLFSGSNFRDDFGLSESWNAQIEKWLTFADSIDTEWYQRNKPRTKSDKQRDELLGEYKALYFIGHISGGQIMQTEPQGNLSKKNDFLFKDKDNSNWYVEVKSPSWRSEVSKKIDNFYLKKLRDTIKIVDLSQWPKLSAEIKCPNCSEVIAIDIKSEDWDFTYQVIKITVCLKCKKNIWHYSEKERAKLKTERLAMPQFITGEGGSFSDKDAVEDAIRKSVDQFSPKRNNLLIIAHNMFAGPGIGILSSMDGGHSIRQIVNKYDINKVISCICLLDVQLDDKGVKFTPVFVPITEQPKL